MNNKKILLFSRDPGGANTIIPLIAPLKSRGYDVFVYVKDIALQRYESNDIVAKDILNEIKEVSLNNIKIFLEGLNPDFILTATSADDFTEKYLWKAGEQLGISSFAILDQWMNYSIRFSDYKVSDIANEKILLHTYLPTKILVMDEFAKEEMIREGFESDKIIISGQPHFENLRNKYKNISNNEKLKFYTDLKIENNELIILFASENTSKSYNEKDADKHYWGFTERTILKIILKTISEVCLFQKRVRKIRVIIKQHPKEDINNWNDIVENFNHNHIKINVISEGDSMKLAKLSNIVIGMSSMLLIESAMLGLPIASIQIGLARDNPFIFDRIGKVKSILMEEELKTFIQDILVKENLNKYILDTDDIKNERIVEEIIHKMEEYL